MGWLYFYKPENLPVKDWFTQHLNNENDRQKTTVLDVAVVKFRTLYAAVETVWKETGKREVWAAIYLLDYTPASMNNFGYKDMDESVGPCEQECPERILKRLTPTEHEYALKWREACWKNLAKRKTATKLKVGDKLHFKEPVHFTNGMDLQDFTVVSTKPLRFDSRECFGLIRITRDLLTRSIEDGRCLINQNPEKEQKEVTTETELA